MSIACLTQCLPQKCSNMEDTVVVVACVAGDIVL